jgi:hypothetical protein
MIDWSSSTSFIIFAGMFLLFVFCVIVLSLSCTKGEAKTIKGKITKVEPIMMTKLNAIDYLILTFDNGEIIKCEPTTVDLSVNSKLVIEFWKDKYFNKLNLYRLRNVIKIPND